MGRIKVSSDSMAITSVIGAQSVRTAARGSKFLPKAEAPTTMCEYETDSEEMNGANFSGIPNSKASFSATTT